MTPEQAFTLGYAAAYQHGRPEPLSDARLAYLARLAAMSWAALSDGASCASTSDRNSASRDEQQ